MSTLMSKLKSELTAAVKLRCREEGFTKKGYWFRRTSSKEGFDDMLLFGQSYYVTARALTVSVGIRNLNIEQLFVKLTANHLCVPLPLVVINIGYLEAQKWYKDWYMKDTTNLDNIVNEIFEEIRQYACPFFDEYADLDRLIEVFEHRDLFIGKAEQFYFLPLLYLITGQKNKGLEFYDNLPDDFVLDDWKRNYIEKYKRDL